MPVCLSFARQANRASNRGTHNFRSQANQGAHANRGMPTAGHTTFAGEEGLVPTRRDRSSLVGDPYGH